MKLKARVKRPFWQIKALYSVDEFILSHQDYNPIATYKQQYEL